MRFVKKIKLYSRIFFSYFFGLFKINIKKNKINIINYHNFYINKKIENEMFIDKEIFNSQMRYFQKYCNLININNLHENISIKNNNLLLTIDDGDDSILLIENIINELEIQLCLFLPIGLMLEDNNIDLYRSRCLHHIFNINKFHKKNIDLEKFFKKIFTFKFKKIKKFEKFLNKKNKNQDYVIKRKKIDFNKIKKLSQNNNFILGSHSMSHVNLKDIPSNWLNWEIKKSLEYINSINGNNKIFSIPYGHKNSFNNQVIDLLNNYNIKYIFTSLNIINISHNNYYGRIYILNSKNSYYLKGLILNSMFFYEKLISILKNLFFFTSK